MDRKYTLLERAIAMRLGVSEERVAELALLMMLRHVDRVDSRGVAVDSQIRVRPWHAGDDMALKTLLQRIGGAKGGG